MASAHRRAGRMCGQLGPMARAQEAATQEVEASAVMRGRGGGHWIGMSK
jgi:hypothetical protein